MIKKISEIIVDILIQNGHTQFNVEKSPPQQIYYIEERQL